MRNRKTISFEKHFLDSLIEDKHSCVELREENYNLSLHPFHLNNINESIKDILNRGIPKYNKELGGILVGYSNINLLSYAGSILNDNYYIYISIKALFYIFKPDIGKTLIGTVNKKSPDHVGCLIHGTFNVSLPNPNKEDDEDDWLGSNLSIGQKLLLRVSFIKLESRLPYIRGEIISILNEMNNSIPMNGEHSKKIISYSDSDEEMETRRLQQMKLEDDNSILEPEETEITAKKKKHKKRKRKEENNEAVNNCDKELNLDYHSTNVKDDELANYSKKKKSKRKYSESLALDETLEDEFTSFGKIKDKYADTTEIKVPKYKYNEILDDDAYNFEESQHISKKRKSKHKNDETTKLDSGNEFTSFVESETKIKEKKSKKRYNKLLENNVDEESHSEKSVRKAIKQEPDSQNFDLEVSKSKKKKKIKEKLNEYSDKVVYHKIKEELNEYSDNDVYHKFIEENSISKKKTKKHNYSIEQLQKAILEKTILDFAVNSDDTVKVKKHKHKSKNISK